MVHILKLHPFAERERESEQSCFILFTIIAIDLTALSRVKQTTLLSLEMKKNNYIGLGDEKFTR